MLAAIWLIGCDDYNKRDTPGVINFTFWQSISKPEPMIEECHYLKFYETTFDLLYQKTVDGEIVETNVQSGNFTYRMPKIRLETDGRAIQGIVTGRSMLLGNGMVLDLTDIDVF